MILCFDTTNQYCSVALSKDGLLIAYKETTIASRQAENLILYIEDVLKSSKIDYMDLTAICMTIGPGSFTGIRIGIAAAKGLRLATKLPFITVSNFEIIAANAILNLKLDVAVLLDARRDNLYIQPFTKDLEMINSPQILSIDNFKKVRHNFPETLIGDGAKLIDPNYNINDVMNAKLIVNYVKNFQHRYINTIKEQNAGFPCAIEALYIAK